MNNNTRQYMKNLSYYSTDHEDYLSAIILQVDIDQWISGVAITMMPMVMMKTIGR